MANTLIDTLRQITDQDINGSEFAIVKSVDSENLLCDVQLLKDDSDVLDVLIHPVLASSKAVRMIPTVESIVVVSYLNNTNTEAYISLYSEVDEILIDSESIVYNGGENEGIVKVIELTDKLNALEDDLNSLKQVFSTFVPVPQDGGAALKAGAASWAAQTIINTNKNDIQNEKIKH